MNIEEILEDAFENDDDVVELQSLETDFVSVGTLGSTKKRKEA